MPQDIRNRYSGSPISSISENSWSAQRKGHPYLKTSGISIVLYIMSLIAVVMWFESRLPNILTIDKAKPGNFVGERAENHLKVLSNLGPKPTGSHENEVMAVNYLLHWITNIKNLASPVHKIEIDLQKPTGCFNILMADKFTSCYANVQNIVVKVNSENGSTDALLINCHFDSVPSSPGASDDIISCAIMLEVLQVITESNRPLRHSLIFLFNGAEENMLQASHGFISQHKWRKSIKAFINLEACGAGGREVLFQSGPNNPWLLQAYKNGAKWPFASVIAQELFQSGVIPSDTDFRVFRDYGNLSGLDVAFVKNGYVYHTKYDTPEQIPSGSIQRAGENLLGVVKYIAHSADMSDPSKSKFGKMVYFDILGVVMVLYPEGVANIINVLTIILSIGMMMKSLRNIAHEAAVTKKTIVFHYTVVIIGIILSWVTGTLTNICFAKMLESFKLSLKWYRYPSLIVGLYTCPALLISSIIQKLVADQQLNVIKSVWHITELHIEAVRFLFLNLLAFMVILRLQSNYLIMLSILSTLIIRSICKIMLKRRQEAQVYLYCLALMIPFMSSSYMVSQLFQVFIPIMGRVGGERNPEIFIAVVSTLVTILLFSFFMPLLHIVNDRRRLGIIITSVWAVCTLLTITKLTFPYSGDLPHPTPQRFLILHTDRTFMKQYGEIDHVDSGYWIMDLDINSPNSVREYVPELLSSKSMFPDCDRYLYCGAPYYYPILSFLKRTTWIPSPSPEIHHPVVIRGLKKEKLTDLVTQISFNITGPDHMAIIVSPASNVTMNKWSLTDDHPFPSVYWQNGRPVYFIYYSYGIKPAPLSLQMDMVSRERNEPLVDVAVIGHYLHGTNMKTSTFIEFLKQFPSWAYVTGWTSSYSTFQL